jgi:transcriptional regulator with XRE-family HTH domain
LKTRPSKNIVGPQVRRLRNERGWSQPAFAAECQRRGWDIDRDTVAKIEGRSRWVSDYEVMILSRIFSVPLDALVPASRQTNDALREFLQRPTSARRR